MRSSWRPSSALSSLAMKRERFYDGLQLIWDLDDQEERAIVERLLSHSVHSLPLQVCQEISYLNATECSCRTFSGRILWRVMHLAAHR